MLRAIPIETGMTGAFGSRAPSQLDTGVNQFRTTLDPNVLSATQHTTFTTIPSSEAWIRMGDVISEQSYFGILYGRLYFPHVSINQMRTDTIYFHTKWNLLLPYFGFTYHYRFRPLGTHSFSYELGGMYGFAASPKWTSDGYYLSPFLLSRLQTNHRADYGNVLRIEAALLRGMGDYVFLRMGISQSYMYVANFRGTVNGTSGYWAYTQNGGLTPLSASQVVNSVSVNQNPSLGASQVSTVRGPADLKIGLTQIFLSIGLRF